VAFAIVPRPRYETLVSRLFRDGLGATPANRPERGAWLLSDVRGHPGRPLLGGRQFPPEFAYKLDGIGAEVDEAVIRQVSIVQNARFDACLQ
jgi:hypothetical protein